MGYGTWAVWYRNFLYFKYSIWVSFFWLFVEPILYLMAFGYGLGQFIEQVNGQPYVEFFYPGLMVGSAMLVSFYEGTYGSYTKLAKQNTFATILQTPVSASEIATGEILWAASKGVLSGFVIGLVGVAQRFFTPLEVISMTGVVVLVCLMTGSFAIYLAAVAKNYDWFMYAQTGLIIPMYLFSGTYFPIESLPAHLQQAVWSLPLTHAVAAIRQILSGDFGQLLFLNLAVITTVSFLLFNFASHRLQRRILD
jgi:lipooligosaccharide transport system permease protein